MAHPAVGIAGIVVVATLVVSYVVAVGAPEAIRTDEKILDWYGETSNQFRFLAAAMIGGVGDLALLVFVVGLRQSLHAAGARGLLFEVGYAAGLVSVAVFLVGIAVGSSVAATLIFSDTFALDADNARIVLTIGNVWLPAVGGIPAALYLGASSLVARRAQFLPPWLCWLGLGLTPLVFLAFPGFGANVYLLGIWILVVSIVLLRRRAPAPAYAGA